MASTINFKKNQSPEFNSRRRCSRAFEVQLKPQPVASHTQQLYCNYSTGPKQWMEVTTFHWNEPFNVWAFRREYLRCSMGWLVSKRQSWFLIVSSLYWGRCDHTRLPAIIFLAHERGCIFQWFSSALCSFFKEEMRLWFCLEGDNEVAKGKKVHFFTWCNPLKTQTGPSEMLHVITITFAHATPP